MDSLIGFLIALACLAAIGFVINGLGMWYEGGRTSKKPYSHLRGLMTMLVVAGLFAGTIFLIFYQGIHIAVRLILMLIIFYLFALYIAKVFPGKSKNGV